MFKVTMFKPDIEYKFRQDSADRQTPEYHQAVGSLYMCVCIDIDGCGGVLAAKVPGDDLKIIEVYQPKILSDDSVTSMLVDLHDKARSTLDRAWGVGEILDRGNLYVNSVPSIQKDLKRFLRDNIADALRLVTFDIDSENDFLSFKMLVNGGKIKFPESLLKEAWEIQSIPSRINAIKKDTIVDADLQALSMAVAVYRRGLNSGFANMRI